MADIEFLDHTDFVDRRGTVRTFLPSDPIVEYNLITLKAGDVRGMHWHPHFVEYLLFVSGEGSLTWRDIYPPVGGGKSLRYKRDVEAGVSTRAPIGVAHAVEATTDLTFIAMLTRRWDDSDPPIISADV